MAQTPAFNKPKVSTEGLGRPASSPRLPGAWLSGGPAVGVFTLEGLGGTHAGVSPRSRPWLASGMSRDNVAGRVRTWRCLWPAFGSAAACALSPLRLSLVCQMGIQCGGAALLCESVRVGGDLMFEPQKNGAQGL